MLRIVGSPILVIPLLLPRSCQSCLTSPVMVGLDCHVNTIILVDPSLELSIAPEQNARLVPPHARKELLSRGIDLENFTPMSQEDMKAQLE